MRTTFDTDTILFSLLRNAPGLKSAISGDIYIGERPDNSEKEDITINTIDLTQEHLPQIGVSNVNIHCPDKLVRIAQVSQKKADRERLRAITALIMPALRTAQIKGLSLVVTNQTTIQEPAMSQHYVNIRINWVIH